MAAIVYGLTDASQYRLRTTLGEQARLSQAVLEQAGSACTLACINTEEVYAFTGRRAPFPFLRLKIAGEDLSGSLDRLTGIDGCDGVLARLEEILPVALVLEGQGLKENECVRRIAEWITERGYRRESFEVVQPPTLEYDTRGSTRVKTKRFWYYLPPGAPLEGTPAAGL